MFSTYKRLIILSRYVLVFSQSLSRMAMLIGKAVLLMLLLFTMTVSGGGGILRKRRQIKITNDLWSGSGLTVHCKSGNDDIGVKTLPRDGTYEFSFRPRTFPATTLFFCSFQWETKSHYYDVYTEKVKCSKCWYSVKEYGQICRFNWDTNQYDKCSPSWNSSEIDPPQLSI